MFKSGSNSLPSLPIGWNVSLNISKNNLNPLSNENEIEVIVTSPNEIAKGKKAIEKLVNNKCQTIEEKRIIFTHVKWFLKRAEVYFILISFYYFY